LYVVFASFLPFSALYQLLIVISCVPGVWLTHADLEILGVDPAYQGYGLGSKLLKWGLSRADEEGVEVYLCSSPEGRRVYEKYGFEGKIPFSLFPGREHLFMIRPIRK